MTYEFPATEPVPVTSHMSIKPISTVRGQLWSERINNKCRSVYLLPMRLLMLYVYCLLVLIVLDHHHIRRTEAGVRRCRYGRLVGERWRTILILIIIITVFISSDMVRFISTIQARTHQLERLWIKGYDRDMALLVSINKWLYEWENLFTMRLLLSFMVQAVAIYKLGSPFADRKVR